MISPHIVRKTTSPVSAPPEAGIHWINTVTGEEYFSVATSSVNDWIIRKNNGTWLNGSGVPSAGLGNDNDNYINNDNGDYYKKVSGSWVLQGNLQGPAGATGATGATGPAGSPGAPGSQIYTGAGVPSPLLGINGDFYVDNTGSAYYHKASGVWVMQGSFGGVTDHGALTGLADNDHPQYLLVSNFNNQNLAMKEPTGFPNRTDSSISFDDMTRTLFISATGAQFDVWVKGTNYVFPSMLAIGKQISTTAGNHYIYFDSAGNLSSTTTFNVSLFQDNAMVAIVYWNSDTNTHTYLGDERHGMQMDGATHGYLHTVFGTRYLTGLALQGFSADGDGSSNSHCQFTVDSGSIRDEDILLSILAQAQIPILFRQGSLWRKKAGDSYPIIYNGTAGYTGTRVPFNEFVTGNWQLTEIVNGNYVLVHYFATNDQDNPVIGILGTNQYTNAPQARSACESEISSLGGLPFAEFTAIGSVIFQSNSSYTNVPKARVVSSNPTIGEIYVDFRGEQLYTPSGVATSHSLLSNLTSDDHLQYHTDARGDARYLQLTGGSLTGAVTSTSTITATNISGTNTGDETTATIKTKLGSASSSQDGYLTSTDWSTFNSKEPALAKGNLTSSTTGVSITGGTGSVIGSGSTVDIQTASGSQPGLLSSTDWTTFNSKEPALTKGNLTTSTTGVTITGGTGSVIGSGATVDIQTASSTQPGLISSADYTAFNSKMSYAGSISLVQAVVANTAPFAMGVATPSVTGTASAVTPANTSFYTSKKTLEYTASSLSSAIAGWRFATEYVALSSSTNVGGFKFSTTFGFQAGFSATQSARRFFVGFTSSTVAPTDVNPSSLGTTQEMFGIAMDNGDANFQVMHSSGSATATKIDLGSTFIRPSADKANFYRVDIHANPGTMSLNYVFTDLLNGQVTSGTVSTNIPGSGSLLSPRCWVSAGGTASAVGVAMEYIYLQNGA